MRSDVMNKYEDCGLCDLCRHEESILGRKLCRCLEAIARLAFAVGVRSSPILTGSGGQSVEQVSERKWRAA